MEMMMELVMQEADVVDETRPEWITKREGGLWVEQRVDVGRCASNLRVTSHGSVTGLKCRVAV